MITTQWYRKSEQASRLGIWYVDSFTAPPLPSSTPSRCFLKGTRLPAFSAPSLVLSTMDSARPAARSHPGSTCTLYVSPPSVQDQIAHPSLVDRYLFAGAWTILWAAVILLLVPDSPRTSQRWFNDREREILIRRSRENMSGRVEPSNFSWDQAKEALRDVKIYIFLVMAAAIYICK